MNIEKTMRQTMCNLQRMFCDEHGIEYSNTYERFDEYYEYYRKRLFTRTQSEKLAYERCENENYRA